MFDHNEYHIYTKNEDREMVYVHLTEKEILKAKELHKQSKKNKWDTIHRLKVGNNIYLAVGNGVKDPPRLESKGYEGWVSCHHGIFEESLFFDTMIFYKCTDICVYDNWSLEEVKNQVKPEHRDRFKKEFEKYLQEN